MVYQNGTGFGLCELDPPTIAGKFSREREREEKGGRENWNAMFQAQLRYSLFYSGFSELNSHFPAYTDEVSLFLFFLFFDLKLTVNLKIKKKKNGLVRAHYKLIIP